MIAYLEISPLFEDEWTGIAVVTAALAEHACADNDRQIEWTFLFETIPLPLELVQAMLYARNGRAARDSLPDLLWHTPPLDWRQASTAPAIFTCIKPMRRYFAREAMVIYDLSPLITPQFHRADTINHFGNRLPGDVASSNHFFCISEATRRDLELYLHVDLAMSSLIRLGIDMKWEDVSNAQRIADEGNVEPYVVVVGTLEPRKNGRIVLDYLASNPDFARRNRIIFIGRDGWLEERAQLLNEITARGIPADRIVFTGYVSEQEKIALIYNARFCIYPSFFEGFGLPVLEAAALGKTVVCSNSSSMPEVAPEKCFFFDPNSLTEFSWAMTGAEEQSVQKRVSASLEDIMDEVGKHDWTACYQEVKQWVLA